MERQMVSIGPLWASRSEEELRELAQIKRFMECVSGDPAFRTALSEQPNNLTQVARERNINIDVEGLLPLFHRNYSHLRADKDDDRWPLARKWDAYMNELLTMRSTIRNAGSTASSNPVFNAWRNRQIARVQSELGERSTSIVHPLVAYELSQGCTVGCWFCGVSAEKFSGYWPFTAENEQKWRSTLQVMNRHFGEAAQTGFCYWATDPSDNPDYVKFLEAFHAVTGIVPQTTTAAPLKNIEQTRKVLKLFDETRHVLNRFSILSVGQLRRVHSTFTADELLGVELVLQQKGAFSGKALAGRALRRSPTSSTPSASGSDAADSNSSNSTIACVTGFLINMVEGRIRLVSPTKSSERWPDGYIVFGEARFENALQLSNAIEALVEIHMIPRLAKNRRLSFRDDLEFLEKPFGFALGNQSATIECKGPDWLLRVGKIVKQGNLTVSQAVIKLASQGTSPFWTMKCLEDLYQAGLLEEAACSRPPAAVSEDPRFTVHQSTA